MKIKSIVIITGTKTSKSKVKDWRANRSVKKVQLDQLQDKNRKAAFRDNLSDEAQENLKFQDKNRKAAFRDNLSDEKRQQINVNQKDRMAAFRDNLSDEAQENLKFQDKNRKAAFRDNLSVEARQKINLKKKNDMAQLRLLRSTKLDPKSATLSEEICEGLIKVLPLEETSDSIGKMNKACPHCGALKFVGETPSSCCLNGQINIKPFPKPPAPILDLWIGNDVTSRIFRQHSRNLNNAVCLSSLKVNEKRDGFSPSVIFQGKVMYLAGSIGQINGETPHYAQLYVLDSDMELTQRYEIKMSCFVLWFYSLNPNALQDFNIRSCTIIVYFHKSLGFTWSKWLLQTVSNSKILFRLSS